MEESEPLIHSLISPGLIVCYIFLGVTIVASVFMPLINAIKNPQGLIKAIGGIVGLVILFAISYALSGSEVSVKAAALGTTAASSRLIGAGMILFYIVLLTSVVLAAYSLIKDIISG
ncbi:MAG: hypothetical protein ING84_19080 [Cytophagales bacterium]|jgi:hypothetical protein|nr:hypothetical protein [Cytophagales bacterium]MCE2895588.1 hypothetical protein [Flammeovirgaceae bacterium]MCA6365785.1 hypothetical protein [Cytophagales bacterium]MCA6373620.1 hypothetical protein [Cytophagales bacterium]MCA6376920.1 hypothetical protein [Cytophagales bacterium]